MVDGTARLWDSKADGCGVMVPVTDRERGPEVGKERSQGQRRRRVGCSLLPVLVESVLSRTTLLLTGIRPPFISTVDAVLIPCSFPAV